MLSYLALGVPIFALFWNLYWLVVRPARERRKTALAVPAVPAPEPREPRDASRPYPRPKGSRSKLNRVCPACGTGRETGNLDRRVLGWPAHRTCAEWLGDWKPASPEVKALQKALDGFEDHRVPVLPPGGSITVSGNLTGIASTGGGAVNVAYTGGTAITMFPGGTGFTPAQVDACALLASGHITAGEARERLERLDREIAGTFGVPPVSLADLFTRKACPDCGMEFGGTAQAVSVSLQAHEESGQCEQRRRKMA